ncbi:MAG: sigma-70 family RNA polymerase sigma factor [Planctomycetota bacterium]
MSEITQLLHAMGDGDKNASEELMAIVYDELHRLALSKLAKESPGHTLQPTALVHEAYMRLLPATPKDKRPGALDEDTACRSDTTSRDDEAVLFAEGAEGSDKSNNIAEDARMPSWQSKAHFFGAAAEAMRRVLIDSARKKRRLKRGGNRNRVELGDAEIAVPEDAVDLLALDEALNRLEDSDPSKAQVVKLRYFAGLSLEETAAALDVSVPTVHRKWRFARAWLKREMQDGAN